MDYPEILARLRAHGYKEVYDFLKAHPGQKPGGIDELLLALATSCDSADYRRKYRALLPVIGGDAVQQAFRLVARRNYSQSTGPKNMLADLPALEQIAGFNGPQFAKALQTVAVGFRGGREYFLEHATDDEITSYFLNELAGRDGTIDLWPGNALSNRAAQLMWDVVPRLAPRLTRIVCRTKGNIRINLAGIDLPRLTELTLEADLGTFPTFVFEQPSLRTLRMYTDFDTFPPGIGRLTNLEELVISMPVAALPDDVFSLAGLQSLKLMHTRLKAIPDAVGQLKSLTYIDLYDNPELNALPDALLALPHLREDVRQDLRAAFAPANG